MLAEAYLSCAFISVITRVIGVFSEILSILILYYRKFEEEWSGIIQRHFRSNERTYWEHHMGKENQNTWVNKQEWNKKW